MLALHGMMKLDIMCCPCLVASQHVDVHASLPRCSCSPAYMLQTCKLSCRAPGCPAPPVLPPNMPAPAIPGAPAPSPAFADAPAPGPGPADAPEPALPAM